MKYFKEIIVILVTLAICYLGYDIYQGTRNSKLSMGMYAPPINLSDAEGNPWDWKNTQGRIVLIDFWASWCGPCRKNNPEILEIQEKYAQTTFPNGSKGIQVVMVSLDDDKNSWLKGIENDRLNNGIIHLSDLKAFKNTAALDYGINSIPMNFLVNEKGFILGKGLSAREIDLILKKL